MRPGERVVTIKAIAQSLAEESLPDIRLILDQFGFETRVSEAFAFYPQLISRVSEGGDQQLLELQEFLFPGVDKGPGANANEVAAGPWADGRFRLFVSHTHNHMAFAGGLRQALAEMGVDAFVAHDQIEPTQEWQDEIESALKSCQALVAILTPDFVESRWCDQEVGYCMARGILIIPLGLGVTPHGFIGKYQCMTAQEDEDARGVAQRLFDLLTAHDTTAAQMAPIAAMQTVRRYAESHSFDNARENFELLTEIPKDSWTPELAKIVERAPSENSQIAFANIGGKAIPEEATRFLDEVLERPAQAEDAPARVGPLF